NVLSDVIENFETIIRNDTVIEEITNLVVNDIRNEGAIYEEIINLITENGGNVYYDGSQFTYIDDNGVTQIIDISEEYITTLIEANESQTLIVTIDGNQYYIAEEYLVANDGVVPTRLDPAALPAGVYLIDVVGGVINNFETIVQDVTVIEEITNLVVNDITNEGDIYEEIINLIQQGGNVYYNETTEEFYYYNEDGDIVIIDLAELIGTDVLVDNLDGSYTHTAVDGEVVTINVVEDVINNFETIVQDVTVIEEITNLVVNDITNEGDIYEEIINLITENGGNVYYDGSQFTYIDDNGVTQV
ncbi:hypothetical protein ACFOUP_16150, partial [Belliella kenyensis]